MKDSDILTDALEQFAECIEAESQTRANMVEDIRFVHLSEQWPEDVKRARENAKGGPRPCLVINKLSAFVRQVVNDARQNRPGITVLPVDSGADPQTAEILSGLIRHIERNSDSDVAYDTAVEWAVTGGLGYFTIGTEYAEDTGFDQEITINRVVNPFAIYGDCDSEEADSSDWRKAFHVITGKRDQLEKQYKSKEIHAWLDGGTGDGVEYDKDETRIARYWYRDDEKRTIVMLSNGAALEQRELTPDMLALLQEANITPLEGREREVLVPRVTIYTLSRDAVLDKQPWAGRYIPIIPVYGHEMWLDNKRYLKSLVRDSMDAQRQYNYFRSATTELMALAPKTPFIGRKGSFKSDASKWATANVENWPYIEYDGEQPPQRQPFAGVPAGLMQEAMNASDDLKAITGIFDASLGARSNETSGRAIQMRQREGDISNFHFLDNLSRAIRHAGRVIVDMIPRVYDSARVVRILGKDDTAQQVPVNQEFEQPDGTVRIYDLTAGRYDVAVRAGPSYTTQRQEAAEQMMQLIQAVPDAAPIIGDLLVKNLDWPGADEIAKRLEKMAGGGQQDPQAAQMQAQMAQQQAQIEQQKMQAELQMKQMDLQMKQAEIEIKKIELAAKQVDAQARVQQSRLQAMQPVVQRANPTGGAPQ